MNWIFEILASPRKKGKRAKNGCRNNGRSYTWFTEEREIDEQPIENTRGLIQSTPSPRPSTIPKVQLNDTSESSSGTECNEGVWKTPNKLNPASNFFHSNLSHSDMKHLEKNLGRDWVHEWYNRKKSKTAEQRRLDRALLEAVGYDRPIRGKKPTCNISNIKKLIYNGATIDHYVPREDDGAGELLNVFEFALWRRDQNIVQLLTQRFPNYRKIETGGVSLLRLLYAIGMENIATELLQTKCPIEPLYD